MTDSRTKDKDTPTTGEVRDSLVYLNKYHAKQYGDVDLMVVGSETAAQFDRMIAEVERAAAEAAVRGFVSRVSDSIEDYLSIATLDALGAEYIRAAAYRREETE